MESANSFLFTVWFHPPTPPQYFLDKLFIACPLYNKRTCISYFASFITNNNHTLRFFVGNFCSPPAAESMIRGAKSRPQRPAGPMSDYISRHQQDQIMSSLTQPHQPSSSSNDQIYEPPHGTCRGHLRSRQPQPSQPQAGMDLGSASMLCQACYSVI